MKRSRFTTTQARSTVKVEWVEIPGGSFTYGLSQAQADNLLDNLSYELRNSPRFEFLKDILYREIPRKQVVLNTFYISQFPITWLQYGIFAKSEHVYSDRNIFSSRSRQEALHSLEQRVAFQGNHPATVPWHSAFAFCEWLGARLPTSIEWEKAARGDDGRYYPWGDTWDQNYGNVVLNREKWPLKTSPVNAYSLGQSPYNIYDMVGNTYEWTLSTSIGQGGSGLLTELVVCKSCSCDFNGQRDELHYPAWFRNLVCISMLNSMSFGGDNLIGFRPIIDQWHQRAWSGF